MNIINTQCNTTLTNIIDTIPTSKAIPLSEKIITWQINSLPLSARNSQLFSRHNQTKNHRNLTNYIIYINLSLSVIFIVLVDILSAFGQINSISSSSILATWLSALTFLYIAMITRLIKAIQHLHLLSACKKSLNKILQHLNNYSKTHSSLISKATLSIKDATKKTIIAIDSQKHFHKASFIGSSMTLLAVTGLIVGISLLLSNIYGGSCIGCAYAIGNLSIIQLLLVTFGSLLTMSMIWNVGVVIGSIYRKCFNKNTHQKIANIITTLVTEQQEDSD